MSERRRVGVFDSGFGGLTVLRALRRTMPQADFLYLGDTARLPYGSKSRATIARYAVSSSRFLTDHGADFLVIACNTASALALEDIRDSAPVPALGVIDAGVNEARAISNSRDMLVIGTDATISSHAYSNSGKEKGLRTLEKACPLLVPLVEEGWVQHPVTHQVVKIYMDELLADAEHRNLKPDTLVLGCTHYPLLRPVISACVPATVQVVDSADAVANEVSRYLGLEQASADFTSKQAGNLQFFVTDSTAKFRRLGASFLGAEIGDVELVDLGG